MNKLLRELLRTMRGQLLLTAALFASCFVVAVGVATQRSFFEKYVREKYPPTPNALAVMIQEPASKAELKARLLKLSRNDLILLYEGWMSAEGDTQLPGLLVQTQPELLINRVERTIVCGNPEQKEKALAFLTLAQATQSLPMLRKAAAYFESRSNKKWVEAVEHAIGQLGSEDSE